MTKPCEHKEADKHADVKPAVDEHAVVHTSHAPTTHMPLVSILMAVYNCQDYVREALESVCRQTCEEWELLCVDDASSDASLSILREMADADSRIRYWSFPENRGPAQARNYALQQARGAYVIMLDADDWLSPNALQEALTTFAQHPQTDCVLFSLIEEYPTHSQPYHMTYHVGDTFRGVDAFRLSLDWRLHGLYMVRATLHRAYPFDTYSKLHSDDNTTRQHYLHAREVRICAGEYHYRKRQDSISFAVGMGHFDYLDANLSMKRWLESELAHTSTGISVEDLQFYEAHRWLNYVGMHWFFFLHRAAFSASERAEIRQRLRTFYASFTSVPNRKFGYRRTKKYSLFLLQTRLYFTLRWLLGRR